MQAPHWSTHLLLCWCTPDGAAAAAQAHDFEAYQELLQETGGAGGVEARYHAISRFLSDTEDYLHRLAAKVASVKLSQEASEAAAAAVAEARAQARPPHRCLPAVQIYATASRAGTRL